MTTRLLDFTSVADDSPHLPSDSAQGAFFTSLDADAEVFTGELHGSVSTWRCDDTLPNAFIVDMFLPQINSNSRGPVLVNSSGNGIGFLIRDFDVRVFEYAGNFLTGGALATYSVSVVSNDTITVEANQSSGAYVIKRNGTTVATYNQSGLSGLFAGFTLRGGTFRAWTLNYTSGAQIDTYPATVRSGSTGNAYTTTGLSSVSSITIGSLVGTSISDTTGDGTHSVPSLVDGVAHELYGTKTVTITGTGGAPTTTTNFQPATGNEFVTLSGTLNTSNTGGLYNFSPAAVVTDQIVFPDTANFNYDAQGSISGEAGTYNCWHIQASTKIARSYTVTLGSGGSESNQNGVIILGIINDGVIL
ncbi:MAG: hypothetical protein IPK77_10455 [Cellvibrio sp.]|nr:hypothetical protein [Cellvibrio sp.]